jgi:hypothetical protein
MHDLQIRQTALTLHGTGMYRSEICKVLNVSPQSTYRWEDRLEPLPMGRTGITRFRCEGRGPRPTICTF